ncbi:FecR domain-containing protein [Paenibacillus nanensis]|uniref:FecR domain-containing protein n=1 Tax=Paenibacillus nanensis TaxID=393251 RepID=UPI0013C2C658|nr:FecR domain-containing protein [Paenibacillus nanensis]
MFPIKKIGVIALACAVACGGLSAGASAAQVSASPEERLMGQIRTITGAEALSAPQSAAVRSDGTIIVSDTENHVIKQIRDGKALVLAGASLDYVKSVNGLPQGAWLDGGGETAFFHDPAGLAVDNRDNVYVADAGNHAIRRIDKEGNVTTVAGKPELGFADGSAEEARFYYPTDVAVTETGVIYVADTLNHVIRRIDATGKVTTIGSVPERAALWDDGVAVMAGGYVNGSFSEAEFNEPAGLAIDDKGNLYVSDSGNNAIRYIDFGNNTVTTAAGLSPEEADLEHELYAGPGYSDGSAGQAKFNAPRGLEWSDAYGLVIADSGNNAVRLLKDGEVSTLAGSWNGIGGNQDGIESEALFEAPADAVQLASGELLIADAGNDSLREWESYSLPEGFRADRTVQLDWNGKLIGAEEAGLLIKHGKTLIPADKLSELLGHEIAGDAGGMAPLRAVAEAQGQHIRWLADEKLIVAREKAGNTDSAASVELAAERTFTIDSLTGVAQVTQGGLLKQDAYVGMELGPGDRIETGGFSSAVLSAEDTGDIITIGEHSVMEVVSLHEADGARLTKLELVTGSAFYDVTDLSDSKDKFEVKAGETVNSVRGTHFVQSINPITGIFNQSVFSGVVSVLPAPHSGAGGAQATDGVHTIYPSQQISLDSRGEQDEPLIKTVNLDELVKLAGPEVIKKIIENKQQIDQENDEQLGRLQGGGLPELGGSLDLATQAEFEKYKQNVLNSLPGLLRQSVENGLLTEEEALQIINEVNQGITSTDRKYDLDREVPPLDPNAGVNPAEQPKRAAVEEKQRQLEEMRKNAEKEKNEKLEQNNVSLIEQMRRQMEALQAANQRLLEEKKKQAADKLLDQLDDLQKGRLADMMDKSERELKEREAEQARRIAAEAARNNPPSSGGYIPPAPGPTVEVEYSDDFRADADAGSNHFVSYGFKTTGLHMDTDVKVGITVKKDGETAGNVVVFREGEGEMAPTEGKFIFAPSEGSYKLSDLTSKDQNPVAFYIQFMEPGQYEMTFELLKVTESGLVSVGQQTRTITVSPSYSVSVAYDSGVFFIDSSAAGSPDGLSVDYQIQITGSSVSGKVFDVGVAGTESTITKETDADGKMNLAGSDLAELPDLSVGHHIVLSLSEGQYFVNGNYTIYVNMVEAGTDRLLGSSQYMFDINAS